MAAPISFEGGALVDYDVVAGATERQAGRETGDASADDADVECRHE